jgi:hypothetical protein
MGPICCPETSVINYHYQLRNNPGEISSQCGSMLLIEADCFMVKFWYLDEYGHSPTYDHPAYDQNFFKNFETGTAIKCHYNVISNYILNCAHKMLNNVRYSGNVSWDRNSRIFNLEVPVYPACFFLMYFRLTTNSTYEHVFRCSERILFAIRGVPVSKNHAVQSGFEQ